MGAGHPETGRRGARATQRVVRPRHCVHRANRRVNTTVDDEAYTRKTGTTQAPIEGPVMSNKYLRQTMSEKSNESLNQKRADRRTKVAQIPAATALLRIKRH